MTTKTHTDSQVNPHANHVSESALSVPTMCVFCRRVMDEPCRSEMDAKSCILFRDADDAVSSTAAERHPTTQKSPAIPASAGRTGDGGESASSTQRPLEPQDIPPNERPPRGLCASSPDPEFCYPAVPSVEATQRATDDAARSVGARGFQRFPRGSALPVIPGSDCPGRIIHPRNERHAAELEAMEFRNSQSQDRHLYTTDRHEQELQRESHPQHAASQGRSLYDHKRTYQRTFQQAMETLRRFSAEAGTADSQKIIREIDADRNKEKIAKRRHWAGSGIIPEPLRSALTPAMQAVCSFILFSMKKNGVCEKYYGYIAKCSGASTKTVQRTVAVMRKFGFTVSRRFDGRKNLPSIIKTAVGSIHKWISRNVTSGQGSPNKLTIERYFLRPKVERRPIEVECSGMERETVPI